MIKSVFIDLDETLFDFHKAERIALTKMLSHFGIVPDAEMTKRYSLINKSQWELLEKKEKTRDEVLTDRFTIFFREIKVNVDSKKAREIYENFLGEGHYFIEGAEELLKALYGKYDLYLASNGTAKVQDSRIARSGIAKYFDGIFISQRIGYDKPSREFFECCFKEIDGFSKETAIIVGDSLSSDILGGINAGIRTCRYNPEGKPSTADIIPDYEIRHLSELPRLLESI